MVLEMVKSKLSRDTHVQDKFGLGYVDTVPDHEIEVAKTDPVQCVQEQELCCVAGITSFKNGAR